MSAHVCLHVAVEEEEKAEGRGGVSFREVPRSEEGRRCWCRHSIFFERGGGDAAGIREGTKFSEFVGALGATCMVFWLVVFDAPCDLPGCKRSVDVV